MANFYRDYILAKDPQSEKGMQTEKHDALIAHLKNTLKEYDFEHLNNYFKMNKLSKIESECILSELYDLATNDSQLEILLLLASSELNLIITASLNNMAAGGHKFNRNEF